MKFGFLIAFTILLLIVSPVFSHEEELNNTTSIRINTTENKTITTTTTNINDTSNVGSTSTENQSSEPTLTSTATSIPAGCTLKTDESGLQTIECNLVCPAIPPELKERCILSGGTVVELKDPSGCPYVYCKLSATNVTTTNVNPLIGLAVCPTPSQIELALNRCTGVGYRGAVALVGGCKVPVCVQTESEIEIEENDASEAAIRECKAHGGEFVVKRADNNTVLYSACITRGDERNVYVGKQTTIPDQTVLTSAVLKLEELRVKLVEASREVDRIADYYESINDNSSARYRRAEAMLNSAIDKVDELRSDIRSKLGNLTVDDMIEIKHKLKYLREVIMKEILYVMLSESDELEHIERGEKLDCGSDISCLQRAFRICRPVEFERENFEMEITGLEDGICFFHVEKRDTDLEMTCRIENFASGFDKPADILPFCQGTMADRMREFGGVASVAGESFPPPGGGPGGCDTKLACVRYCVSNYDACLQWAEEHPSYGIPSRDQLERLISELR